VNGDTDAAPVSAALSCSADRAAVAVGVGGRDRLSRLPADWSV